ncbi:MAG: nodulation protein NfeD [Acidobacteria bacterium]|nr:nodulation protein NfeD [Acidobacteriota bacterium]
MIRGAPTRMDTWLTSALLAAALLAFLARPALGQAGGQAGASAPARVVELRIRDEVQPILTEYILGGMDEAARTHASLILIIMDTPGGLGSSMRDIIQHIMDSPVPVVVYVSPAGSRAASAGFFILLSADIAAMAPGTHTGSASPLLAIGGIPLNVDETLRKKILNDATAYLRSYASKRGRNVALAETAVTEGKAFTEKEALDGKLIDLLAKSPEDLLAQLDGRTITRFDGSRVTLELRNPSRVAWEMSTRQKLLSLIVRPDVFFILLIVGVLGLYTEFTHPGLVAPGVIGGIATVLALFAMHILPVNFAGLLLIALALALFILEAKYTSHGVLGVGGVVAMLLGALMLIRSPLTGAGVSLGVALGVTLPFALLTILLMRLVLRSRTWKQAAGAEQLVGALGEVTEAIGAAGSEGPGQGPDGFKRGMALVHGELWRVSAREAIPKGARVRVLAVDGLTLYVEPAEKAPGPQA